jgi:hypothetical protein
MRTVAPLFIFLVAAASAAPIVAPRDYTPTQGAVVAVDFLPWQKVSPGSEAQVVLQTTP